MLFFYFLEDFSAAASSSVMVASSSSSSTCFFLSAFEEPTSTGASGLGVMAFATFVAVAAAGTGKL